MNNPFAWSPGPRKPRKPFGERLIQAAKEARDMVREGADEKDSRDTNGGAKSNSRG